MSDFFVPEPKELVSDDIKDNVLNDEDYEKIYRESYITIMFKTPNGANDLFGTLIGIELSTGVKIDAKIAMFEAFSFIEKLVSDKKNHIINYIGLCYDDKIAKIKGPYKIASSKIIEFDANHKTCVLAIDLINDNSE